MKGSFARGLVINKLTAFIFCFLVCAALFAFVSPGTAEAAGWEWRQDDWSGGPGQGAWLDDACYETSINIDTVSVPGTMRLSHVANPYAKDAANPVLARGGAGAFDQLGVDGTPLPGDGGGYFAMYTGTNNTGLEAVGYASTPNGVNWQKHPANPVLERSGAGAWDAPGVAAGPMIRRDEQYYLWFTSSTITGNRYGLATSFDLVNWDRTQDYVFGPGSPTAWDAQISDAQIMKRGEGFEMWYRGNSAGGASIGYATSPDGITWTKHAANPVLRPGTPGAWDDGMIESFHVLKRTWVGDYFMLYSAQGSGGPGYGIGAAVSPDGVNWTKHPGNPVIVPGAAGSWNDNALWVKSLSFDGSLYRLVMMANTTAGGFISSGEAISTDGLNWPPGSIFHTLPVGAPGAWDADMAELRSVYYEGGDTVRAFYQGANFGGGQDGVGTAVSAAAYAAGGTLTSSVFDAGSQAQWGNVTWEETVPAACTVSVYVRTGDVQVPDGTWSAWTQVLNGATVPGGATRYIQYGVQMTGPGNATPVISSMTIDLDAIPTTWYFAEGYTGSGFDEWITIQNPNAATANVEVTYYVKAGAPEVRNHPVPANSRYTIYVNTDLGQDQENSFRVRSDRRIICERPMYFRYSGIGGHDWRGGHVAMGSTQLSRTWYFAEGYTADNFEEWITIQNPNPDFANVDVTYYLGGGGVVKRQYVVQPQSRYTIFVNSSAGWDREVSAAVSADQPILAERPMYFNYQGSMDGGHIVMGSPYLARDWYLAEGATFDPFTEYITIQNPNHADATVVVAYYTPGGAPITRNHTVPANTRYTINAGVDSGVESDLSAYLHSNLPILVERPMYFDMLYGALPGGHCAMGVNSPSTSWYFGEGYTGQGFDEWLTVQNPGAATANLIITYYVQGEAPIVRNHPVPAQSRYTINVGVDAGENLQLSAYVNSDQPVICERPMYFFYQGHHSYNWPGGHDSPGFAP